MTQYFPSKIRHIFDPEKGLVQEIGDPSTVTFASGTIIEVSGVFAYVPEDPSQWAAVPTNLIQAVDYLAAGSGSGGGGGGGGTPGGSNGDIQYKVNATTFGGVNNLTFVGGNLVGTGSFNGVFSGSLTKLTDGTSYIKAGSNITVTTASNGSITITSTGGGGTISGSISANQIAYGTATNTISGSGDFTYDGSTLALNTSAPAAFTVASAFDGQFLEVNSSLYSISLTDPLNPTNNLTLGPTDVGLGDGSVSANMYAGQVSVTDNGTTNSIGLSVPGGEATLKADDGAGALIQLHLSASSLTMQSSVASGDFLTIDSNTQRLTVVDPGTGIDLVYLEGGRATIDAAGNTLSFDAFTVPTITTLNVGSSLPMPLNLSIEALQINADPGSSGQVLTSQGAGAAPIWTTPIASASTGSSINVVYVAKNGSDASVSGSINSPFLTIQGAINYIESKRPSVFANDQDVVVAVAPGVYSEDITFTKPFINVMGYVPTQYSKATQLRGLVNINNTTNPGGGTGQIFGIYNMLITPPTTASANVISFSGTGNGSLILENMQVVGGGSNQSILYVSKSAAVATNCRVKARHSIFNIETAGSAGPTANIFNVYSVFESCEIGYSGSVAGGTVLNSDSATIEFYRGTLSATTANSIVAKITGSAAATVTVGDTAVIGTTAGTNGFLLAPGAYLIGGKNAYTIATGTTFVVSGSATSNFITAFDGIIAGGILYNNRISNTMTTTFASASFTKVT